MKRNQKQADQRVKQEKFVRQGFTQLHSMNDNQNKFLEALKYCTLVVAQGSAGTGKTFVCCWHAARKLFFKDIKKIVLIRAYQPLAGRSIGFLPGEQEDKLKPFYQQMLDYFEDFLGKGTVEVALKNKDIEICSLETIRGRSWENSIIIVDESQSLHVPEVQALVTRVGENSQMIFCGDNSGLQTDIKGAMDGLTYLQKLVDKYRISDSAFINFTRDDIVRSGMTKEFVIAFETERDLDIQGKDCIISQVDIDKAFKKQR